VFTIIIGILVCAFIGATIGGAYNKGYNEEQSIGWGAFFGLVTGGIIGVIIAACLGLSVAHYEMKPIAMLKVIPFKLEDDSITTYQGIKVNDQYYRFYIQESTGYKYLKSLNFEDSPTYTDKDVNDTRIVYYESTGLKEKYKLWAFTFCKEYRVLYLSMKNGEPKLMEENSNIQ
jgi:hypothetical protein